MKKIIAISLILLAGCGSVISDEEICIDLEASSQMKLSEAFEIAEESECGELGELIEDLYECNEYTGSWWIGIDAEEDQCYPSCVVDMYTKKAEVEWLCAGGNE